MYTGWEAIEMGTWGVKVLGSGRKPYPSQKKILNVPFQMCFGTGYILVALSLLLNLCVNPLHRMCICICVHFLDIFISCIMYLTFHYSM